MTYPGKQKLDRTILYTPDGLEYPLDGGRRFVLVGGEYGMPPLDYVTQRGPFQHGDTVFNVWLRPRPIQLVLRFTGCSRAEYWNHRAELLDMVRPNRSLDLQTSQHRLAKWLANGTRREILVVPDSAPTFPAPEQGTWDQFGFTDILRFIANDPTWYDPALKAASFSTVTDYVSVDLPDGYTLSYGDFLKTATLAVRGNWLSYPVIVFTGPITNPTIYNSSTGEILSLSGSIAGGATITFDLRYGYKTITRSDGMSILANLSDDSNLVSFHLGVAPEVSGGNNILYATGTGQTGATSVEVTWHDRFIGI